MPRDEIPPLLRDVLYARQHGLLTDSVGRAALRAMSLGVRDELITDLIQEPVRKHKIASAFAGPFELPGLHHGDLFQGFDFSGSQLYIPLQYLNAHSITLGSTGSGKTNRVFTVAVQMAGQVRGLWLFDCRKRKFIKTQSHFAKLGVQLIILPGRMLRFNPLQVPDGVDPHEWVALVSDMLVGVFALPPRATKLLQRAIHRLYNEAGILDGERLYPTIFDLNDAVRQDRKTNPQAREAVVDNLEPVLNALGSQVLAYHQGWSVHELSRYFINFVLAGIPETAQNLILNTLLLAEFASRIARGISNSRMDLLIVVDEGQRLLSTANDHRSALLDLWPLVRGTGIGLDVSVPTSHRLAPEAMSFTSIKYLGRCGSASDYDLFGRAMGLSKEQLTWALHHTKPGRFITQVGEGDWRKPYVLDVPLLRPPDMTAPVDVGRGKLDALPALPS